jgi:hypothetical protein
MKPQPSERGMSFSGFLIFICSAWKFPSIIKPCMKRILLKYCVGNHEILMSLDIPIVILPPIFWEVDSWLCAQGTEHSHRSQLLIFIICVSKAKSLSRNEGSPLSADPQKLPILVLSMPVSPQSIEILNHPLVLYLETLCL